jgi:phosphatidylserine decarboxylase
VNDIQCRLKQLIGASLPESQTPFDSSSWLTSTTTDTSTRSDEDILKKFGNQVDASVGSNRNAGETLIRDATVALKK